MTNFSHEHEQHNTNTLESIRRGDLMFLPDLTDPNTTDPNELVLGHTGQPSGFVSTREFFARLPSEALATFAPRDIVTAYEKIQSALGTASTPSEAFLKKEIYPDYLRFVIFMTTGKLTTLEDMRPHLNVIKQVPLIVEDQLITLPAAIIGFSVTNKGGGKDGVNMQSDYREFLRMLTKGEFQGFFTPLCAQYGTQVQPDGSIFAFRLQENLARDHALRTMKWQNMLFLVQKLKNNTPIQFWSTLVGDRTHVHSIVPKVIRQYAQSDELVRMLLLIDRHFSQMNALSEQEGQNIVVTDLHAIETTTEDMLVKIYGSQWYEARYNDLDRTIWRLEQNEKTLNPEESLVLQLTRIALLEAYPAISRFSGMTSANARLFERKAENLEDDLAVLTREELQEWLGYRGFNHIDEAKRFLSDIRSAIIHQGEITIVADAIHEVVLYFSMGFYAASQKLAVIGLDIDHDDWMMFAWKFGYNMARATTTGVAPVLYARNPDTGKTESKYSGKSYGDVYFASRQHGVDGIQPLSRIALREYFCL